VSWVQDFIEFQRLEDELNLFDITIQGVKVWERIRFQIYSAIETRMLDKSFTHQRKNRFSRLIRLLKAIFSFRRNPRFAPKSDIMFVCSARRVLENDGMWWDIYTDPITQEFEVTPIAFETHFNNQHYGPEKTPNLRYFDFFETIAYLKRTLGITKITLDSREIQLLGNIADELNNRFQTKLKIESITRRLLEERKVRLPQYISLLKRIKPKIVVLAQGYYWEDMIEACRLLGIKTVELQHGVIYQYHAAYSYEGHSRRKDQFADYILLWGDYWKSSVVFPIPEERSVSVGFPYLESKRNSLSGIEKKRQILFISQGNIGVKLSEFAVAVSETISREYKIVYKLHPQEQMDWREKYPWLVSSSIEVVDPSKITLHELFAESEIQVGVCSTALFEGLAFGLRTYVLDASCVELMNPIIEKGIVKKVSSPEEFSRDINRDSNMSSFNINLVFKDHATENIISFLRGLLDEMHQLVN